LARFVGCVFATLSPLRLEVAVPAAFTVLVAAGVAVVLFSFAGWAATSAKDLAPVAVSEIAGPFTAAGIAAGRAAVLDAVAVAEGR